MLLSFTQTFKLFSSKRRIVSSHFTAKYGCIFKETLLAALKMSREYNPCVLLLTLVYYYYKLWYLQERWHFLYPVFSIIVVTSNLTQDVTAKSGGSAVPVLAIDFALEVLILHACV